MLDERDDAYLWLGQGPADPTVESLERTFAPLRFDPNTVPPVLEAGASTPAAPRPSAGPVSPATAPRATQRSPWLIAFAAGFVLAAGLTWWGVGRRANGDRGPDPSSTRPDPVTVPVAAPPSEQPARPSRARPTRPAPWHWLDPEADTGDASSTPRNDEAKTSPLPAPASAAPPKFVDPFGSPPGQGDASDAKAGTAKKKRVKAKAKATKRRSPNLVDPFGGGESPAPSDASTTAEAEAGEGEASPQTDEAIDPFEESPAADPPKKASPNLVDPFH